MFFGIGGRGHREPFKRIGKEIRQQEEHQEIVEREDRLAEQAEADYIAEQKAKEVRQSKGLGSLITPARNETEEKIAAKKKKQGLGTVISSNGSALG